jgi:polyhydroxybutyrate depolymerase
MRRLLETATALGCFAALFVQSAGAALAPSTGCEEPPRRKRANAEARCYATTHDSLERFLRIYAPAGRTGPLPVVFVIHGGGGSAGNMEWLTENRFNRIADREGVLVVYPEGIENGWNDGRSDLRTEAVRRGIDDLGFLRKLPQELSALFSIDSTRVYSTGISNGGFMSFRLACDAADVFAAVAPVTANFTAELAPRCRPARPISVAILNGTDDSLVPWGGGAIRVLFTNRGEVLSVPQTIARWRELNDCAALEPRTVRNEVADDGTTLRTHAARCAAGTELALFEIEGGGHTWPGGVQYLPRLLVGRTSRELDGAEVIWEFLRRFTLPR